MSKKISTVITCKIEFYHDESWDPDEFTTIAGSMLTWPHNYDYQGIITWNLIECERETNPTNKMI